MKSCTRHSRRLCFWCASTTLSFPLEHALWEKAPILRSVTAVLGL